MGGRQHDLIVVEHGDDGRPRQDDPQLERELRRKEQELAEMAALIALEKKLESLWGGEDESTSTRSES